MNRIHRTTLLKSSALMLLILVSVIGAGSVYAASLWCRSDPIIFLSDGTKLQFEAAMATTPDDVIEVRYELHGPVGVHVRREIHIPSAVSDKETFTYYADQPAGQYRIVVTVFTESEDIPVQARARVWSRNGQWRERSVLNGHSNQAIQFQFPQQ